MNPKHTSEEINSYFIEQIKDYAIFAMDTEGIITTWNQGVEQLKGYKEFRRNAADRPAHQQQRGDRDDGERRSQQDSVPDRYVHLAHAVQSTDRAFCWTVFCSSLTLNSAPIEVI